MRRATIIAAVIVSVTACGKRDLVQSPSSEASPGRTNGSSADDVKPPAVSPPVDFDVVSDIPDCLTVTSNGTREVRNLLLARIDTKIARITSECGCTWKWLLYRSMAGPVGLEAELASGTLFAGDPSTPSVERLVVLLSDRTHPPKGRLVLHVGCAPAP